MPVGAFVSTGRSMPEAIERVQLAESLGYASAYVTHINGRDALQVSMAYAQRTERIRIGTGVVPIYSRTPATMAQEAATIDDASGGRMMLGIGVSHRPVVEAWHGQTIDKPVTEMREYTAIVRAILDGEPPPQGDKWTSHFQLGGIGPFPDLPIGIAALSPNMLRLAGEIGDAVILWLCNPNYIRDVVVPCVREGRERSGRTLDGFDIIAAVPSAATGDVDGAYASMRRDLLTYFGLPFYRAMLERSRLSGRHRGTTPPPATRPAWAPRSRTSSSERSPPSGTRMRSRAGIQRYLDAGATSPCVGPIQKTDFTATLHAGAPGA